MNGAEVARLGKRWRTGTRLFYAWKKAELTKEKAESESCMAQAEEWAVGALEDAALWPGLCVRLEPLGKLKIEEQDLTRDWIMDACKDRRMALVCFAVRFHRIQAALEKLESVPATKRPGGRHKGDGEINDEMALAAMLALWEAGKRSVNGIAKTIVAEGGDKIPGNSHPAKIHRLSKKFRKLVSLDSNPN